MKNTFTINHRNILLKTITAGCALIAAHLLPINGFAQTYTFDQQALGQLYLTCYDGGGNAYKSYWPSNSSWLQSVQMSGNCDNSAQVVSQPSNWSPSPSVGVYPGGPGAVGADVVLGNTYIEGGNATVNHLTLQANASLAIGLNTTVLATTADIQEDTIIGPVSYAGQLRIASGGSLTKSAGNGVFGFGKDGYGNAVGFQGVNASLVVKSGTVTMPYGGSGAWYGGTFAVSNNASIILNVDGGATPTFGDAINGVGGGRVILSGNLQAGGYDFYGTYHDSLKLNFAGDLFQWTGGNLTGTVTNNGTINITNAPSMNASVYNNGTVKLANASAFVVYNGFFNNQSGGTIDLQGDASLLGGAPIFNNGLFKKSAGSGISLIFSQFQNFGGTVEVDSGTLAVGLVQNDTISNATFIVNSGATFDLSISNQNTLLGGVLTGSGGGSVFMNNGTVLARYPTTLNFPGSMFQLAGGLLGGENSTLTNAGTINLTGPAGLHSIVVNNGSIIESGAGDNNDNSGQLYNYGVYEVQNNGGAQLNYFNNFGLLKKTGGGGTSVINSFVNNSGTIQATNGMLSFTKTFNQNAGTLQITPATIFTNGLLSLNGGMITGVGSVDESIYAEGGVMAPGNPFGTLAVNEYDSYGGAGCTLNFVLGGTNKFSQMAVVGGVILHGTLNVTLTNGYVPAIGTRFQIVSSAYTQNGFDVLNVPPGIAVTYSNNGVYLIVTGSTPVQLQSPKISGDNLTFSFATTNGLGYTVQQNADLTTTNWTYYTNLVGNGSLYQVISPVTNFPQRFFRVRQP